MKIAGKVVGYNSQSFKLIFERLFPPISLLAARILNDTEKGKDVAQEAFVKLWRKDSEEFEDENALRAYLYVLVKNACISLIRKEKKILKTSIDEGLSISEQEFLNEILREETYQLLRIAIRDLSPQAVKVVEFTLKGYANLDIAEELSVSINTVKTIKRRAYLVLRKHLGHQFVALLLTDFIKFF